MAALNQKPGKQLPGVSKIQNPTQQQARTEPRTVHTTAHSRHWIQWALIVISLILSSNSWAGGRQRAELILPEANRPIYEAWGFAPAIKTGDYIHVSGVIVVPEGEGDRAAQYRTGFTNALNRIDIILKEAGASLDDVIKINSYHTDVDFQLPIAGPLRKELMKPPHPAWTAVGTTGLAIKEGVTEIEVVAYVGE